MISDNPHAGGSFSLNQDGMVYVTCLPDDPTIRRGMKGKDDAGKGRKNEREGREGNMNKGRIHASKVTTA